MTITGLSPLFEFQEGSIKGDFFFGSKIFSSTFHRRGSIFSAVRLNDALIVDIVAEKWIGRESSENFQMLEAPYSTNWKIKCMQILNISNIWKKYKSSCSLNIIHKSSYIIIQWNRSSPYAPPARPADSWHGTPRFLSPKCAQERPCRCGPWR